MAPPAERMKSEVQPSNNLWIGNLAQDTLEEELLRLFEKHGPVDSVNSYPSRSYAFVYFRRLEDARSAKETLQGANLRGSPLKIEYAKPAKPCKSLWVAGISQSVSKEELEEQFAKYGKIQDFRFLRDRNTAYIDYYKLEDASQALKSMNGRQIGGDQIRVDFLRSQPARKEEWPGVRDSRGGQFLSRNIGPPDMRAAQDGMRLYPESVHAGSKRQHHFQPAAGRKGDGQLSKVLWISYPPSIHVDEAMLRNAMILFGEIERVKTFNDRPYAFVEFRSVDEARCAKEGLQGKLFNDPRLTIEYSSSNKDHFGYYPGTKDPNPDVYFNEVPPRPQQMDIFGHNRTMTLNNISSISCELWT